MSNIPSLGVGFPIAGGLGAVGQELTPDALMAYCQDRLNNLDTQMQEAFADQKKAIAEGQCISDGITRLNPYVGNGWDPSNGHGGQDCIGSLQFEIDQLPDGDAKKALIQVRDQIADRIDPDGKLKNILDGTNGHNPSEFWSHYGPNANPSFVGMNDKDMVTAIGGNPNTNVVTSQEVSGWVDSVKDAQNALNSNSELNMINLQALMSQRQEAIQMCTNLVQSLGDQANKIAQNIGH